jgi:peptidoglycan hydrolase-like protein with peptidoglycan-binding domain
MTASGASGTGAVEVSRRPAAQPWRAVRGLIPVLTGALALATLAGPAHAATSTTPTASTPAPPPAGTPTSPTTPSTPATPVAGRLSLMIQHAHGRPPFALAGERIVIRGVVIPYVAGQRVLVTVNRSGRRVLRKAVTVLPVGNGAGQFHLGYSSARAGTVEVRAEHAASSQMAAFAARPATLRFISPELGQGATGEGVRVLQSELNALHYAVPLNGAFDEATGRAVIAYRKMTGLARVPVANAQVFRLLAAGAGRFHVRYPGDGRHVEADLTRQVLAEIESGGRVRAIYTTSSGKPSTPTVIGRFQVYSKTPGTNSEGMVDSNYFIRGYAIHGYAIHGYAEVPTYAASHGCLRVPIPDAAAIFAWVQLGDPVDVYYENGAGSSRVRANAGP